MMWERCTQLVEKMGGAVALQTEVRTVHRDPDARKAVSVDVVEVDGSQRRVPLNHLISSMPLSELLLAMEPAADPVAVAAANDLRYRDFLTVALVVPAEFSFPDNWIYIHDPGVKVGRIQNFGSWSPYLVKDGRTCLGMEFFVFEGDEMWNSRDEDLVALATAELEKLGLVKPGAVESGHVVRMPKAYPVYDEVYERNVAAIRSWLEENTTNVHPVGRNGMHRYNNADHSMVTALLAARNVMGATPAHDVWTVNVEDEYHEEKAAPTRPTGTGRDAPVLPRSAIDAAAARRRGED